MLSEKSGDREIKKTQLGFQDASHLSSILFVNIVKQEIKCADFKKKIRRFFKFNEKRLLLEATF